MSAPALSRQLASIDPPPAAEIIDREIAALEAVIRRIEVDIAAQKPKVGEVQPVLPPQDEAISPQDAPDVRLGQARPQAPVRSNSGPNRKPLYAVAGAVALVVVMAIATLAYLRRNEPPAMANQRAVPAAPAQPPTQAPKQGERVASGTPDTPARPSPSAQVAAPAPLAPPAAAPANPPAASQIPAIQSPAGPVAANPTPASPPAQTTTRPQIAVANRLVMAMEGTDRPENVVVRQGSVVWRTEMVSGGQGQAPQLAIKALLDAPDARMRAEMTIQRNRDAAFPASHTIQVQFTPGQGSEFGAVRNLSQIELRQSENQPGYPLAGQGIAVVENVFLLALTQIEPALSRNVEMMRMRPLLYLEFQSSTGRRGLMVVEKGVSGQQAFDEAFRNWQ
jgi:hypothetical protein